MRKELVAREDPDAIVEPAGEAGLEFGSEAVLPVGQRASIA
jgi:hypothetical protein